MAELPPDPLRPEALRAFCAAHPEWEVSPKGLCARFVFEDFREAFAFMQRVALEAERLNHHPDWQNSWNRVRVCLCTTEVDAITGRDTALAAAILACR